MKRTSHSLSYLWRAADETPCRPVPRKMETFLDPTKADRCSSMEDRLHFVKNLWVDLKPLAVHHTTAFRSRSVLILFHRSFPANKQNFLRVFWADYHLSLIHISEPT